MDTIWIFCGLLIINGVLGDKATTSTVSWTNTPTAVSLNRYNTRREIGPTVQYPGVLSERVAIDPFKIYGTLDFGQELPAIMKYTNNYSNDYPKLSSTATNNYAYTSKLPTAASPKVSSGRDNYQKLPLPTSAKTFSSLEVAYPPYNGGKFVQLNSPIGNKYNNHHEAKLPTKISPSFSTIPLSTTNYNPNIPLYQNSDEILNYNPLPQSSFPRAFNHPAPTVEQKYQPIPTYAPTISYPFTNTKVAGNYQLLSTQPQLHFHGNPQPIYHTQPFIKTDVEVINKKPPPTVDDDLEDFDLAFRQKPTNKLTKAANIQQQLPRRQSTFELPDSSVFNSYDEAFGKFAKLTPEAPVSSGKIIEKPERYNAYNSGEQSEKQVYDDDSSREKYQSDEAESSPKRQQRNHYYDSERQEEYHSGYDNDDDEPTHYDSYGHHDFEHDFDESYRAELPQEEYPHVKEVPEFEGSASNEKLVTQSEANAKSSGVENKKPRKFITTTPTAVPTRNFGSKLPKKNSRITASDSTEDTTEHYIKTNLRHEKYNNKYPIKSTTKSREIAELTTLPTSVFAPSNGLKAAVYKQAFASPYIHRGGLHIVDPPSLGSV